MQRFHPALDRLAADQARRAADALVHLEAPTRTGLADRALQTARLRPALYRDLAVDPRLTTLGQAAVVVVVAGASGAGGATLRTLATQSTGLASIGGFFASLAVVVLSWLSWSLMTWLFGTQLFSGDASFAAFARGLGFAHTPLLLLLLWFVPVVGDVVAIGAFLWVLAGGFLALWVTLRLTVAKTLATFIGGSVPMVLMWAWVWGLFA